ncbi:MAG TPA: phosphoribosylamine--glycine ligase [Acidimicrobiales bacterium]|nr:phosphoribosylamine--glycine ligase [Acidimicrobiales bacterium]
MTRVVVVGAGAREHALALALSHRAEVIVAPGNAGIAAHGIACSGASVASLDADLVVVGPEQPLVEGLADELRAAGVAVVGPGREGARLEGSKAYLKDFLAAAGVPTAAYATFSNEAAALAHLETMTAPYVIKTDGLAAGKGVLVTSDLEAARADVRDKLSGSSFGAAGTTVVLEEGLVGFECSLHVLCDGTRAVPLVTAQDFKRVGDGDVGANTGGMGAFAPLPAVSAADVEAIMATVIEPTLAELRRRGVDYRGVLYAGLMIGPDGAKLIEYNVRFGDPETEVLAPLYGESLFALLEATATGELVAPATPAGAAVTVVVAAQGYPGTPRRGDVIFGLADNGQLATPVPGVNVYHAGTARDAEGRFVTAGGRVLALSAVADSIGHARERAYAAAATLSFDGMVMRTDIAGKAVS